MKRFISLAVVFCWVAFSSAGSYGEVLFSEDFEGTKTMDTYNNNTWVTIPGFTSSDWVNCKGMLKDTTVPHSGSRCAKFYGDGGDWNTSEMYSGGALGVTEFWVSWWERLSTGYHIDTNHKWFLVQLQTSGGDYYTSYQCNNGGGGDTDARMRIYSQPINALYGYANQVLPTNTWYQLKTYYKLNTPGKSDGTVKLWIKKSPNSNWETWHDYSSIDIRDSTNNSIDSIRLGGTRTDFPSRGIKYIDDVIVGTSEADVDGTIPPPIADDSPPQVTILEPTDNQQVPPGVVTISAHATDDSTQGVAHMELSIDGQQMASAVGDSLIYNWNTRKLAGTNHTIIVKAFDHANTWGIAQITVSVTSQRAKK